MKVPLTCMKCLMERGVDGVQTFISPINDNRYFELTCQRGHKTFVMLQNPKHEVLFEIGLNALIDGYPREAISSFASCLEVFYEFCIRRLAAYKGLDSDQFEKTWKAVSLSERQIGAFAMLGLFLFESAPILLNEKCIRLRNKVIHQGKIPSFDEVLDYGERVVECISCNLKKISDLMGEDLDYVFMSDFYDRARAEKESVNCLAIATTIGWPDLIRGKQINLRTRVKEMTMMRIR